MHISLTYPFVLSWSMLEAMAAGCVVVGSTTPPVEEVIEDGVNGLLVDFFAPEVIAARVEEVLGGRDRLQAMRLQAQKTVLERFDLQKLLPKHLEWVVSK